MALRHLSKSVGILLGGWLSHNAAAQRQGSAAVLDHATETRYLSMFGSTGLSNLSFELGNFMLPSEGLSQRLAEAEKNIVHLSDLALRNQTEVDKLRLQVYKLVQIVAHLVRVETLMGSSSNSQGAGVSLKDFLLADYRTNWDFSEYWIDGVTGGDFDIGPIIHLQHPELSPAVLEHNSMMNRMEDIENGVGGASGLTPSNLVALVADTNVALAISSAVTETLRADPDSGDNQKMFDKIEQYFGYVENIYATIFYVLIVLHWHGLIHEDATASDDKTLEDIRDDHPGDDPPSAASPSPASWLEEIADAEVVDATAKQRTTADPFLKSAANEAL